MSRSVSCAGSLRLERLMTLPIAFDHCVVHVSDWERSNAFYRDVLGAELVRRPQGWAYRFGAAQLNLHGPGLSSRRGGAPAGRARQQRSLLRMERADRGRHRPSRALPRPDPCRSDAALRRQGRRHQRLFPRSRRLAAGIHFLSFRRRRPPMTTAHDPNVLPADLPAPQDDGGARHLTGMKLPSIALAATDGSQVDLSKLAGRTVVYIYPRTGVPGQPSPDGWDAIPGARGCTPQSCSFRDHFAELQASRRRASFRPLDPGHRLSARGGRSPPPAVSRALRRKARARAARSSCRPSPWRA